MNGYVQGMRLPFLTGSLVPVVLGATLAYHNGSFRLIPFLITLIGVGSIQIAANLINDYYDYRGTDKINRHVTPFSGGSRVIQEALLSPRKVLIASLAFFFLALVSGIVLVLTGHPLVALIGLMGLAAGFFYSARPVSFMSRGLGEIVIFLAFGPLITWGTYYVMTHQLTWEAFFLGLPLGFLIAAVIWINQFPDFQADSQSHKRNLVVRLGLAKSRWVYLFLMSLPFPFLLFLIARFGISPMILLAWVVFPLSVKAMRRLWNHYRTYEEVIPAQAFTIQTHLALGLLMTLGILLGHFLKIT